MLGPRIKSRCPRSFERHFKNHEYEFFSLDIPRWQTPTRFLDFFPTFEWIKDHRVIGQYHKHLPEILDPTYKVQVAYTITELMKLFRSLLLPCCLIQTQLQYSPSNLVPEYFGLLCQPHGICFTLTQQLKVTKLHHQQFCDQT